MVTCFETVQLSKAADAPDMPLPLSTTSAAASSSPMMRCGRFADKSRALKKNMATEAQPKANNRTLFNKMI